MNFLLFTVTLLASLATLALGVALLRVLGLRDLPGTLSVGAGYGIGAVLVSTLPSLGAVAGVGLAESGWAIVVLGLIIGGWQLRSVKRLYWRTLTLPAQGGTRDGPSAPARSWHRDPLIIALLLLLAAHLAITVSNNLLRPVFPWDAFTTWMYRAKAWALSDAITAMASVTSWVASGGEGGYALYASHYPTALSAYAAFLSSLAGGWHAAAASIPWSLCLIALCLVVHGTLVLCGVSQRLAVIGGYFIGSMPLLNIHAALAGYGDLWMALYAGGGLALMLAWRISGQYAGLLLGLVMLIAGTQIKSEGALWLGLGITFLALDWCVRQIGHVKLLISLAALASLAWLTGMTHFSLGPLGLWGIDDAALHAGILGSFALRPYNPAHDYWVVLFERANFLFLAGLYITALAIMLLTRWRHTSPILLMGILIVLSQVVIFGLSSFSLYAESETAMTRLLLQFIPVGVVTVILGWSALSEWVDRENGQQLDLEIPAPDISRQSVAGAIIATLSVAVLMPLGALWLNTSAPVLNVSGAEMAPVVGSSRNTGEGIQFVESPISVGVLKVPNKEPIAPPRYLLADITANGTQSASLYWINEGETRVNSTPIPLSGRSIVDLHRFDAWRDGNKKEAGVLVQAAGFESTDIKTVTLTDALDLSSLPALANHWLADEPLTQNSISDTSGHIEAPLTVQKWLYGALLGVMIMSLGIFIARGAQTASFVSGAAVTGLWALAASMAIAHTPMLDCLSPSSQCLATSDDDPHAKALVTLSDQIKRHLSADDPILVINAGDELSTQKLPLLLLPYAAAPVGKWQITRDWQGAVVVLGEDARIAERVAAGIPLRGNQKVVDLAGARIIVVNNDG